MTIETSAGEPNDVSDEMTMGEEMGATTADSGLSGIAGLGGRNVCRRREIASAATLVSEETWTNDS